MTYFSSTPEALEIAW